MRNYTWWHKKKNRFSSSHITTELLFLLFMMTLISIASFAQNAEDTADGDFMMNCLIILLVNGTLHYFQLANRVLGDTGVIISIYLRH